MAKILEWTGYTLHDLSPKKILGNLSKKKDIEQVFIIAMRKDGEFTYHASQADMNAHLTWCERFKFKFLNGEFD